MNTEQTLAIESISSDNTLSIAEQIGRRLKGGEVIDLTSDLGGGKTTFVRGLARGMGSHDTVHSPSFTLSNEYRANKLTLHHFDFYRLSEPGIMRNELAEILTDQQAVVVIEWAQIIEDILPSERFQVSIAITGENSRKLVFTYPPQLSYLMETLNK